MTSAGQPETLVEGPARIVLAGGGARQVDGPVLRDGELILFHDAGGRLLSLRESQVERVEPVEPAPSAGTPAERQPATPAPSDDSGGGLEGVRYTNADLPEIPVEATESAGAAPAEAEAEAEADELAAAPGETEAAAATDDVAEAGAPTGSVPGSAEPADAAPAAAAPGEPEPGDTEPVEVPLVVTPTEIDGKPESWWREEVATRRAAIAELEQEESLYFRLLVCVQNDIPLEQGKCFPMLNRLPKVNRMPRTPTERSLTSELADATRRLEVKRGDLALFLERAMAAGVPTHWLFEE